VLVVAFSFTWLLAGFLILIQPTKGKSNSEIRSEARALLDRGVTSSNQLEVERLLLELESDYAPNPNQDQSSSHLRSWLAYAIGIFVFVILLICPKRAIGIWAGRQKLERERWWTKAISVSIPTLILTGFLIPILRKWILGV